MSADRGRLTYHPPRKYREIVSQQGRVLLDADSNEGQRIVSEETRKEARDFVGPCGTADDGYEVVPSGGDFQVTAGTMYVGGLRVTLETAVQYSKQSEWLDTLEVAPWAEGLWRDPGTLLKSNIEATLVLREQEITAVEDPALREVALGGPDTAARTRILQRIVAADTKNKTCADAAKDVGVFWSSKGLVYDAPTAELRSRARLQVTPVTNAPPPSPCDPPSASGYLGADNQMIRVQVTAFDPKTNTGTLLWSYFNASTLYRCTVESASTLKLATRPVSAEYQPRTGQVVQVLSRAADLGEGAFAAALTGHFAKLTAPYAPDTQIVTLPAAMPQPPYSNAANVSLRLWEDQVNFTIGTAVILTGTGLQVTITANPSGPLHIGDYWSMAVRPSTPNAVYPERLLTTPQPPDGPRMWACPLAVLAGNGKQFTLVDDCSLPFDNLVELTAREQGEGCACTVCVTPSAHLKSAPSLQMAIDQVMKAGGGTVCLEVGSYPIKTPLRIQKTQSVRMIGKGDASRIISELTTVEVTDSHDVALESFAVECRGTPKLPGSAVLLHSSSQLRVEHLTIVVQNPGWSAIGLSGAIDGVAIRGNVATAAEGVVNVVDPKKVGTGVVDLCIEDNRFACDDVAVRLSGVSVLQQVSRIAGNRVTGCSTAGFEVTGATVPGFGIEVVANELKVAGHGIVAGINGLRAIDNDLIGPKASGNAQRGIFLVKGFAADRMDDAQIVGNRIAEFGVGIFAEVPLGSVTIARNQIARTNIGLVVIPVPVDSLSITGNQMIDIVESAMQIESTDGRVAACGNQLEILAGKIGVSITCRSGDCVYADNHSQHVKGGSAGGVELLGRTLIVTSNRVIGKVSMSLKPQGTKPPLCTVVGNITGGPIIINGSQIVAPSPWEPVNLQNV